MPETSVLCELNIKLIYHRWLNVEYYDDVSITISADSGKTWQTIEENYGNTSEYFWNYQFIDLSNFNIEREPYTFLRYNLGPTDASSVRSGWNIDNFAIVGDYIESDVGISQWISPLEGCGHTDENDVTIIPFKNMIRISFTVKLTFMKTRLNAKEIELRIRVTSK